MMHPPGTVCVVVRTHHNMPHIRLGDTLTCIEVVFPTDGCWHEITPDDVWWQGVQEFSDSNGFQCYPIPWMRPIDADIDADDVAVVDALKKGTGLKTPAEPCYDGMVARAFVGRSTAGAHAGSPRPWDTLHSGSPERENAGLGGAGVTQRVTKRARTGIRAPFTSGISALLRDTGGVPGSGPFTFPKAAAGRAQSQHRTGRIQ